MPQTDNTPAAGLPELQLWLLDPANAESRLQQ